MVYPPGERPTFVRDGEMFAIIDCSELGLRFEVMDYHPEVGATMSGAVRFRRGVEVPVTGEVVRVDASSVALWFGARGIPLSEILAERAYLASAADELA